MQRFLNIAVQVQHIIFGHKFVAVGSHDACICGVVKRVPYELI